MRSAVASLVGVMLVATSCGSPAPGSPTPQPTISAPATGPASVAPGAPLPTAAPPTPVAAITGGRWESAGSLALGRENTHALTLGDGRVLVVGNDVETCVRADSRRTELYDPATGEWSAGPRLNKGRAAFAAVTLADGRALVTGGINPDLASYSSTYVLDPADPAAGWGRSGVLDNARTSPACAALADGRVLVAGGFYQEGMPEIEEVPGEMGEIPEASALVSAELFDPSTGTWSKTGRLRMARNGAAAVGLADGRVLVAGSLGDFGTDMFGTQVSGDADAFGTAEVLDPDAGRFALTGRFPPLDWGAVLSLDGAADPEVNVEHPGVGTLVALPGGDALLFGRVTEWFAGRWWNGLTVRTFRFGAAEGTWRQVDQVVVGCDERTPGSDGCFESHLWTSVESGHSRIDATIVVLADGKVLVAGGTDPVTGEETVTAELFDPDTGAWIALPPLPEPRAGAAGVLLDDGSALIMGGYVGGRSACDCDCPETGLATAVRFVPEP